VSQTSTFEPRFRVINKTGELYLCNLQVSKNIKITAIANWLRDKSSSITSQGTYQNKQGQAFWEIRFKTRNERLVRTLTNRCQSLLEDNNQSRRYYEEKYEYDELEEECLINEMQDIISDVVQEGFGYSEAYMRSENDGWFYEDNLNPQAMNEILRENW
jgi:hypothetical protein